MNKEFFTISELTTRIKRLFDSNADLKSVKLKGEISNFTHHSRGHFYFTLKDESAQIKAVMFSSKAQSVKFKPESGMEVIAKGYVTVYEASGQYQIIVTSMEQFGKGNIFVEFEKLKEKLRLSGKLDKVHKKEIPKFPNVVGVITSPTGAAIKDIYNTIERRFPLAEIHLYPTLVQGVDAKHSVVRSIELANRLSKADVLIVGRGGGSIEDLWAFNEEIVADAIFESKIPIISAVGHETDFTISDLIADVRAATPTAAAELAVPDKVSLMQGLKNVEKHITRILSSKVNLLSERLKNVTSSYLFESPERLYDKQEMKLDNLVTRLHNKNPDKLIQENIHKVNSFELILTTQYTQYLNNYNNKLVRVTDILGMLNPAKKITDNIEEVMRLEINLRSQALIHLRSYDNRIKSSIDKLRLLNPIRNIVINIDKVTKLENDLRSYFKTNLSNYKSRLASSHDKLELLNPRNIMSKGYSIVKMDNKVITDTKDIVIGDNLEIILASGLIRADVKKKEKNNG